MALESAQYINQLVSSNPPSGDPAGQACDHLRLIKSTIQATFPNITGPVTADNEKLSNGIPVGGIIMFSGSTSNIATGWALCDGGTYAAMDGSGNVTVPDLRDKFIVGAGNTYAVAATGGATSAPATSLTVGGTALTVDELPSHTHTLTDEGHTHAITDPKHAHTVTIPANGTWSNQGNGGDPSPQAFNGTYGTSSVATGVTVNSATTGITVDDTGSGNTHAHTLTGTVPTLPPYYALALIIKL